jgi:SET domain-containing protein
MLLVKTNVRRSLVHGFGLFAAEFLHAQRHIWHFHPKVDIIVPERFYKILPPESQRLLDFFAAWDKGIIYLDGDDTRYLNHSSTPNVRSGPGKESMWVTRDVHPGEELLCDYREFDEKSRDSDEPYLSFSGEGGLAPSDAEARTHPQSDPSTPFGVRRR